jgi:hypothetical protein
MKFSTPYLSQAGVERFAFGWQKAKAHRHDLEALDLLGKNLGLLRYGEIGAIVKFDPFHHNDLNGGLLPGQDCIIVDQGWSSEPSGFLDDPVVVLIKADVRPGTFAGVRIASIYLVNHGFTNFVSDKPTKFISVTPESLTYRIRDYDPRNGTSHTWSKAYSKEAEQWLIDHHYTLSTSGTPQKHA